MRDRVEATIVTDLCHTHIACEQQMCGMAYAHTSDIVAQCPACVGGEEAAEGGGSHIGQA